jgi:FtsZ-interacting cell division protein ZipA
MINLIIPTLIVSTIAIVVSLIAIVLVLAQRWSTHKIEWKPLQAQDPFTIADKETKEADEDDGKILEEALNLQRKGKKQRDQDPLTDILETNNF